MVEMAYPEGVEIHPTAIVCREALLEGSIRVGAGTVVHPFAIIKATNGPIIIGENNIIEDRCLIENILNDGSKVMEIGDQNIIEVGAVGVRCKLFSKETLPERTVIYGKWNERRTANDNPPIPQGQLEVLRRLLPSYHYLQKSKP
ncbi:unnamed protein product [Nippostrongylus brasiliensis]|uniref:Dynactin subunit 6 n=1 Tax=Nippostrongylus brasiliensis TaxID=27835 RepID=A0A0N4YI78_NIPBR|nr:unnamed protein product [Nippostrongylus brasiliensis]